MNFSLRFLAHSEVGRVRKNNQDAGYASPNMILVADGMGGAAAGDLASAVAVTQAQEADERVPGEEMLSHMEQIVAKSNAQLAELVESDLSLDGMGTTFCGAMFDGMQLGVAHIGDSRLYLLREGQLQQLTHDHSWVQSFIDEGRLTPEQAAHHPHRSLILRVVNGQAGYEPDLGLVEVQLGDRLLVCSDGLSGLVPDAEIADLLASPELSDAENRLARAANEAGGHDNITMVLADVVEQSDDLDQAAPQIVGSAVEREIPDSIVHVATAPSPTVQDDPGSSDQSDEEAARYAPEGKGRRWPGIVLGIVALVLGLSVMAWAGKGYADTRYFVGASEQGQVAIYNGLDGAILGYSLNSEVEVTEVAVSDLPVYYQDRVTKTISTSSLADARNTTAELAVIAERCVAAREARLEPTPTPTTTSLPTSSSSPSPSAPTNSNSPSMAQTATASATATEEADPEAC